MATGSKHPFRPWNIQETDAHHNPQLLFNLLLGNTTHFEKHNETKQLLFKRADGGGMKDGRILSCGPSLQKQQSILRN